MLINVRQNIRQCFSSELTHSVSAVLRWKDLTSVTNGVTDKGPGSTISPHILFPFLLHPGVVYLVFFT